MSHVVLRTTAAQVNKSCLTLRMSHVTHMNATYHSRVMRTAAAQVNTPRLTLRISLICTIISNKTCILVQVNQSHLPPPEKLLGDGFSTPMPLFCLICTIISNKTCILVQVNQSHLPPPEKLLGDGFSTPMPLFCLICTIISNKTCILVQVNQSHFTLPANAVPHTNESCHTYEWEGSKVSTLWVSSQLRRRMSLISHISFTHE